MCLPLSHGNFPDGKAKVCLGRGVWNGGACAPVGGLLGVSMDLREPRGIAIRWAPAQLDEEQGVACKEVIQVLEEWD